MCQAIEEIYGKEIKLREGRGEKRGERRNQRAAVLRMLQVVGLSPEQVADLLGLPLAEVRQLAAEGEA